METAPGSQSPRIADDASETITKKALVDLIAERTGQKRVVVKETVQQFLDLMIEELAKGNRLEFRDFGVFEVKGRARRVAQNPRTLERVEVPPKRTVKFKPGKKMRDGLEIEDERASQSGRQAGSQNAHAAPGRAAVSVEGKPEAQKAADTTPATASA